MAEYLTVYCTRSVAAITPDDFLERIGRFDFYTLAEGFGIDDEAVVDQALRALKVEPASSDGEWFEVHYATEGLRPILVHRWTDPERVQTEREEAKEFVEDAKGAGVKTVLSHLGKVTEVVAFEMKWSALENMGVVIAGNLAEYLAEVGDGLIRDQNDDWWGVKKRVPYLLVGPKRH
jgi:hypothetical protein